MAQRRALKRSAKAREHYGVAANLDPSKPPSAQYPGQRRANDPWLAALRDVGYEFWRKRGVAVPPTLEVDVADDLEIDDAAPAGVLARGWFPDADPSGRIALRGYDAGVDLRRARSGRRSVGERRAALEHLATLMFHEMGHAGGVQHTPTGLMDPTADAVPWEAKQLIRRLIPKPKPKQRRHGV